MSVLLTYKQMLKDWSTRMVDKFAALARESNANTSKPFIFQRSLLLATYIS